jgi:hypothetical protein
MQDRIKNISKKIYGWLVNWGAVAPYLQYGRKQLKVCVFNWIFLPIMSLLFIKLQREELNVVEW